MVTSGRSFKTQKPKLSTSLWDEKFGRPRICGMRNLVKYQGNLMGTLWLSIDFVYFSANWRAGATPFESSRLGSPSKNKTGSSVKNIQRNF